MTEKQEKLATENLNLVHFILKGFNTNPDNYDDLFQQGCYGLCKAAEKFDESLGFKFSTYAAKLIKGHIQRYKRDCEPKIKYGRKNLDLLYNLQKTAKEYNLDLDNQDDLIQIIELGDINETLGYVADLIRSISMVSGNISVGSEDGSDGKYELFDILSVNQSSEYLDAEFEETLDSCIEYLRSLNLRGIEIYEEYIYSLVYGYEYSQEELAKKYNLAQSYVSRLIKPFNIELHNYFKKKC